MNLLDRIKEPADLKKLDISELPMLAKEIRKYLVEVVSESGGHLSSNLGVVELTIALHYCFNSPVDKIIWDVGHQSYVHKILTGRKEALKNIRQFDGISGFPKRSESPHDVFDTGHSSTSISAALGFAYARELKNEHNFIIPVIGDGALTGGMAFEALNNVANLKSNLIVVLNDNQMSISPNVGGISRYLDSIRTAGLYNEVKEDVQKLLRKIPKVGEGMINAVRDVKDSVKQLFIPGMFFEEMGLTYIGPIDGHNIKQILTALNNAKRVDGPVLIHVNTIKGKGYKYAEAYPTKFHATKSFEKESGTQKDTSNAISYSSIFGETVTKMAKTNSRIVAITAAMREGTGLDSFEKSFPKRFFDVGIAEQHAITFAGGLAVSGLRPYVAIYSSFLQRAYDQILHDIALQKLPVVIGVDRSGIVGDDGETHQGVFDTSFLNHIPNMTIMAPKDGNELRDMLLMSEKYEDGPICIKYPKENSSIESVPEDIEYGKMEIVRNGEEVAILSVGTMFKSANEVCQKLNDKGISTSLINVRFIKPMDLDMLEKIATSHKLVVVMEESSVVGGFGSEVLRHLSKFISQPKTLLFGVDDAFLRHGTRSEILDMCGLTSDKMTQKIIDYIIRKG